MDTAEILERLERTLAQPWRKFLEAPETGAGSFRGGVDACATQLERAIAKIREEIANG